MMAAATADSVICLQAKKSRARSSRAKSSQVAAAMEHVADTSRANAEALIKLQRQQMEMQQKMEQRKLQGMNNVSVTA
jgi:hypothetical protein